MKKFKLVSDKKPAGDQPQAIEKLVEGLDAGVKFQTLLGVTGSGKTYTMAKVIEETQKPTLVLCHNKTLAAQNYAEFKEFFPDNAVSYFVSYYDYYQPEAYVPQRDLFIEKEADINKEIERMRTAATTALLTRKDVIIVASVSCIYGIGSPEDTAAMSVEVETGEKIDRSKFLRKLADLQYERNEQDFYYGTFRVKGDTIDVFPPYQEEAVRLELFGDDIDRIMNIDYLTGEVISEVKKAEFFPAKQFVTPFEKVKKAAPDIIKEQQAQIKHFKKQGRLLEAERIKQRTNYDIEMLLETGYVSGIENYTRYIQNKEPGQPPSTLLDYFAKDFLLVVDEAHITLPQVRGMYNGDRARKETLVDYGFRLPSALDNRPLKIGEFWDRTDHAVAITATPADLELDRSRQMVKKVAESKKLPKDYPKTGVVELLNRPTGLLDPKVEIRPSKDQIADIIEEIRMRIKKKQKIIITTLTKRMSEDLTNYLKEVDLKVQYLHSEIDTMERVEILRDLRLGIYDVLVGINLLREGIDLPEVSLVVILDADKEGFLRSRSSLIQTMGRAARHEEGKVILYADKMTDSMKAAIDETKRRRKTQEEYNKEHGITPTTIIKAIRDGMRQELEDEDDEKRDYSELNKEEIRKLIKDLSQKMKFAAQNLEYEKAAEIRDEIRMLRQM